MTKIYTEKKVLKTLDSCIKSNTPILLIGETGTGKTTLIKEFSERNKKELVRVSLNGNISTEEILGKFLLKKEETVWQDGILTEAVRSGKWIVFDEINSCSPEILFAIHGLLDNEKALVLPEKDNERIPAHKDFRFIASMNPQDYAGTKTLNQAFISRFIVLKINYMSEDQEIEFLVDKYKIKKSKVNEIVSIGSVLRKMKKGEKIDYFCSTRDLEMTIQLLSELSLKDALTVAVFNKMNSLEIEEIINESKSLADFISTSSHSLESKIIELQKLTEESKKYESKKKEIEIISKENNLQLILIKEQQIKLDNSKKDIDKIVADKVTSKIKSLLS